MAYISFLHSPESNDIIRAGRGVSSEPFLDQDLYKNHLGQKSIARNIMPKTFQTYITGYVSAVNMYPVLHITAIYSYFC